MNRIVIPLVSACPRLWIRAFLVILAMVDAQAALAQRAKENAVGEALDAFGTAVGREAIGLYSAGSARGFSPTQAGNLRIEGMFFETVQFSTLGNIIARGSSVHVGIAAQGYPFPAPTGVVDYTLREPGNKYAESALIDVATHDSIYGEVDAEVPIAGDVLSVGGGFGQAINPGYSFAVNNREWNAGAIARWQPSDNLKVVPFWSTLHHRDREVRPLVFLANSGGYPRFKMSELPGPPWSFWSFNTGVYGVLAQYRLDDWELSAGAFRSYTAFPFNTEPTLSNLDSTGRGEYGADGVPAHEQSSNTGEVRLSRVLQVGNVSNIFHLAVRGRDQRTEAGGSDSIDFGRATVTELPPTTEPQFHPGPVTLTKARQVTAGIGYEGVWRDVGQLSASVQRVDYRRTTVAPGRAPTTNGAQPWLYNVAAAGFITDKLAVFGSYTRGFEETGRAPSNAVNRDQALPAALTQQVDAGLRYRLLPQLTFVTSVFEIKKPYVSLDAASVFRRVGDVRNRGVEASLAGTIENLTLNAGATFIDPKVKYDSGTANGQVETVAIGPIPMLVRVNMQYRTPFLEGLILEARGDFMSKRKINTGNDHLPEMAVLGAGVRYNFRIAGKDVRAHAQVSDATNVFSFTAVTSGFVPTTVDRVFDFSLTMDF